MFDDHTPTRREFVKVAGTAAVGASLFPADAVAQPSKRRYAIVGTGDRGSGMWGRDLVRRYPDLLEFVGLCDVNPKRAIVARDFIGAASCPTFTSFDEMIEKTKPDLLMVTTVDGFHHEYIIKGLDRGLDVMTEKPLTTDETKCQAILDAEKRNDKKIVVTFNYRYAPAHQTMKEILLSNDIGKIVSVDFS
jgi:predicted dehydrogenase